MLKGNNQLVVAGAVAGHSLNRIAADAGLSRSTVQRRLKTPAIAAEVERLKGKQREKSVAQYTQLRSRALTRLDDLILSENESLALKAIGLVLNSSLSYERYSELEVRVRELQQAMAQPAAADGGQW